MLSCTCQQPLLVSCCAVDVDAGTTSLLVYMPIVDGSTSVTWCPPGTFYHDTIRHDGLQYHNKEDAGSQSAAAWHNLELHNRIVTFAAEARDKLLVAGGNNDFGCMARVMCRVDILCLFPIIGKDELSTMYDFQGAQLLLNEVDIFNACSTAVDVFRPGAHDALATMCSAFEVPGAKHGRQPFHDHWTQMLLRELLPMLVGPHQSEQATWSKARWERYT